MISTLGQIIREHRKKAGLTQIELAKMAGVGKTVIHNIEHGKKTIQLDTLFKIFKVLNMQFCIESPLAGKIAITAE